MGVFNLFIVLPEVVASVFLQPLVKNLFGNQPLYVVMMGGASLLLAALLMRFVDDPRANSLSREESL
jgi:maltose/moltooligosaccharide transporter